jgi:hypothetical protein
MFIVFINLTSVPCNHVGSGFSKYIETSVISSRFDEKNKSNPGSVSFLITEHVSILQNSKTNKHGLKEISAIIVQSVISVY